MSRSNIQGFLRLIAVFAAMLALPVSATVVELKIQPNNLIATAEFKAGKPTMPAVVLVHGFLQTRDSPTLKHLTDDLNLNGYTTLSPTLTLGVSKRTQSLGCEAIHTHTAQSDSKETEGWISFLSAKGYKQIVLIGHSNASTQILMYLSGKPAISVKKAILLSMVDDDFRAMTDKRNEFINIAHQKIDAGDHSLYPYKTYFCSKYASTAEGYLSYFDSSRTITLKRLQSSKKPVDIILGGTDDSMGKDWPNILKNAGNPVTIIKDGNHFFDNMAEFDLLETVSKSINILKTGK